jgi:hypothetical protein
MMFSQKISTRVSKAHMKVIRETLKEIRKEPGNKKFTQADLLRIAVSRFCIGKLGSTAQYILGQGSVIDRSHARTGRMTEADFEAKMRGGR